MDKIIHTIPFLRITVALATGIVLGPMLHIRIYWLLAGLVVCVTILLWINSRYRYSYTGYYGAGVLIFFVAAGIVLWKSYNVKPPFIKGQGYEAVVLEYPAERSTSSQSVIKLTAILSEDSIIPTNEQVIIRFYTDENVRALKPGDVICFSEPPVRIRTGNNPFEFNYTKYLEGKKIYRQVYLKSGSWRVNGQSTSPRLKLLAEKVRHRFLLVYANQDWDDQCRDVLSALTLGYKRELDPELKTTFTASGTMHVLAVSGLHTGILYFIACVLFGFLKKYRAGKVLFVTLVIITLWTFAFLTGLSPSVRRAAAMFTLLVIGQSLRRRVNTYNTLSASAFLLLCGNPNLLSDVGFQLSYAAVFGIVFLQPKLAKRFDTSYRPLRYIIALLTVSVAAQVATFPLTSYYFHQFPVYFLLSNLIVIPVVTLVIPIAFLLLALHWIPAAGTILSGCIKILLNLQIQFLEFVERLPHATVPVDLTGLQFVLITLVLVFLFVFIGTGRITGLKYMLLSVVLFLVATVGMHARQLFRKEIIVYNLSGQHIVHLITGKRNYIISDKGVVGSPFTETAINRVVRRFGLREPVQLTSGQSFNDSVLYLRNGVIYFEGKVVSIGIPTVALPVNPDFVVMNRTVFAAADLLVPVGLTNSEKYLYLRQLPGKHELWEKGAYINKW